MLHYFSQEFSSPIFQACLTHFSPYTQFFSFTCLIFYRVSDESGKMEISLVCENALPKASLTENDVYLIDSGQSLFVYIGVKCSRREKLDALSHAHVIYLKFTVKDLFF